MLSMKNPFPGQYPDEKIIIFRRRHWASFLGFFVTYLFMIIFFFTALTVFFIFAPDTFTIYSNVIIILASAYLLFMCLFFLTGWIDYYFDIMILTDHRLIDIHQKGLFNRAIDELELLHIEDVSAEVRGYLPTFFNYGELVVETAGTARNFVFHNMPDPRLLSRQTMQAYENKLRGSDTSNHAKKIAQAEGLNLPQSDSALQKPPESIQPPTSPPPAPDNQLKNSSDQEQEIKEGEEININPNDKKL